MDIDPAWASFSWTVTVVRLGLPMELYRELKMVQNRRNSPLFLMDITFADVLFNLSKEYDRLTLNGGKGTAAMVVQAYNESI